MWLCVRVWVRVSACLHGQVSIHMCLCTRVCLCMCVCLGVYVCVCACTYLSKWNWLKWGPFGNLAGDVERLNTFISFEAIKICQVVRVVWVQISRLTVNSSSISSLNQLQSGPVLLKNLLLMAAMSWMVASQSYLWLPNSFRMFAMKNKLLSSLNITSTLENRIAWHYITITTSTTTAVPII